MKIVFTGGGTAGHVTPCVAVMEKLKDRAELHYFGSDGMERGIVSKLPYVHYHEIRVVRFIRPFSMKNFLIPFRLGSAVRACKKELRELSPDAVFSKGGYVALPVCLAAECPVIIHESDLSPGLCTKLVKNKAKKVCAAFEPTAKKFRNGLYTGLPLRSSLYRKKIPSLRPRLLVMGGSLGAQKLNDAVCRAADELLKTFDIFHITGKGKATDIKNPHYRQVEFCEDMGEVYARTDVALTRGGSTALFELAALKIPSLAVPLGKAASRGDQIENAEEFSRLGRCRVLTEEQLAECNLTDELTACLNDETLRKNLAAAKNIDATDAIALLLVNAAREKNSFR